MIFGAYNYKNNDEINKILKFHGLGDFSITN